MATIARTVTVTLAMLAIASAITGAGIGIVYDSDWGVKPTVIDLCPEFTAIAITGTLWWMWAKRRRTKP